MFMLISFSINMIFQRELLNMTEVPFDTLSEEDRNELIAFHGKAQKVTGTGEGFSGGVVFLGNGENVSPRSIAAKYPKNKVGLDAKERALRFLRELEMQAKSHYHQNVHWPFKVCMILGVPVAYFRRWEGDLSSYIEGVSLGDTGRLVLMIQLVSGLLHCHARGLIHQDLKPENIFVRDLSKSIRDLPAADYWFRPMVADFGSVNLASEINEYRGSRPYMAPEQWNKEPLDEKTSSFVVGIILHELMSRGRHPEGTHFGAWHRGEKPMFNRLQKDTYWRKWLSLSCSVACPLQNPNLAKVVSDCLQIDPALRPNLTEIQHRLQSILAGLSHRASCQSDLFLVEAKKSTSPNDWADLNEQLASLARAIEKTYPSSLS
ncbi:MAG: protein kinase [Sulfitobacter sp.]